MKTNTPFKSKLKEKNLAYMPVMAKQQSWCILAPRVIAIIQNTKTKPAKKTTFKGTKTTKIGQNPVFLQLDFGLDGFCGTSQQLKLVLNIPKTNLIYQ